MFTVQEKTKDREIFRIQKEKAEEGNKKGKRQIKRKLNICVEWLVLDRQKHTVTQTRDTLEDGVRRETKKNHLFTSVFSLK